MKSPMTSDDLIARLKLRYPDNGGWAFFEQVANGTGYSSSRRWADGLAVGLWPSEGLLIHGFEVKVSRSDWVKEMLNPQKAEAIAKYCDFWWLVVSDASIVHDGELPTKWGLLVPRGDGLTAKVAAARQEPTGIGRPFIAVLARHMYEQPKRLTDEARAAMRKEVYAEVERQAAAELDAERKRADDLQRRINAFAAATGVSLDWRPGQEVVRLLRALRHSDPESLALQVERTIVDFERTTERVSQQLRTLAGGIRGLMPASPKAQVLPSENALLPFTELMGGSNDA